MTMDSIRIYHQRTKHRTDRYAKGPGYMDWENQPDPFRRYSGALSKALPLCAKDLSTTFEQLDKRSSIPTHPLNLTGIATLLEISLAISAWKEMMGEKWAVRCNPSSGNLHPTEGYVVTPVLDDLKAGVWHYDSLNHRLEQRGVPQDEDLEHWSSEFPEGVFLIGLTSIHGRETWKYGERSFRYCHLNLGHAAMAVGYGAACLGWKARILDSPSDEEMELMLGLDWNPKLPPAEKEDSGLMIAISTAHHDPTAISTHVEDLAQLGEKASWNGRPNHLTQNPLREWVAVREAYHASHKPRKPVSKPPVLPERPMIANHCSQKAVEIIHQRRSAARYDGQTALEQASFFRMLDALLPCKNTGVWDLFPVATALHPVLIVHRVIDVDPGVYILPRHPVAEQKLKHAMRKEYLWEKVDAAPAHLPFYLLERGDGREFAQIVSCRQEIAGDGAFTLGMLAEFDANLKLGAWHYRRLHEEAGALGQVLYLEAEAAGAQGTGIGCFFDDYFHNLLGLEGDQFQTLYHFTVGAGVVDKRLSTIPPYDRD
ncbi:MAG: SagB/ThcOx family dehydrogenase [Magnetococcales bacterium]|nr:SagB/ThcOx family dehydrogenase [Magnetococcales bacterium]